MNQNIRANPGKSEASGGQLRCPPHTLENNMGARSKDAHQYVLLPGSGPDHAHERVQSEAKQKTTTIVGSSLTKAQGANKDYKEPTLFQRAQSVTAHDLLRPRQVTGIPILLGLAFSGGLTQERTSC